MLSALYFSLAVHQLQAFGINLPSFQHFRLCRLKYTVMGRFTLLLPFNHLLVCCLLHYILLMGFHQPTPQPLCRPIHRREFQIKIQVDKTFIHTRHSWTTLCKSDDNLLGSYLRIVREHKNEFLAIVHRVQYSSSMLCSHRTHYFREIANTL